MSGVNNFNYLHANAYLWAALANLINRKWNKKFHNRSTMRFIAINAYIYIYIRTYISTYVCAHKFVYRILFQHKVHQNNFNSHFMPSTCKSDRQAIKGIKRTKATSFKYEYSYGQLLIYTCRIAMTKNDEKISQIENSKIF